MNVILYKDLCDLIELLTKELENRAIVVFNKLKEAQILAFKDANYDSIEPTKDSVEITYYDNSSYYNCIRLPINIFLEDKLLEEYISKEVKERKEERERFSSIHRQYQEKRELQELKRLLEKYKNSEYLRQLNGNYNN